jgi:threonine dehydrogenase-like Zn-dependent dehydrogenase
LKESLALLSQKKLNVVDMITHRFGIREAAKGFRLMTESGKSLKVIIEPNRV